MNLTPEQKSRLFRATVIFVVTVAGIFGVDAAGLINLGI